jgi:hypothetical protein
VVSKILGCLKRLILKQTLIITMEGFKVRIFNKSDSEDVIRLISHIIVNEFKFKLEIDSFYEITNLVIKTKFRI